MNLLIINFLSKINFVAEALEYDSVYHVNLVLKQDIIIVLQEILSIDSLKNMDFFNSFLRGHIIFFLVKLKNLQKTNVSYIDINDSFSFVFNKREMVKKRRILLKDYFIN